MTFQCCFGMCKSQPSQCVSPCSLTSCTRGHCSLCGTAARPPPLPASRQCASFTAHFCSLFFFFFFYSWRLPFLPASISFSSTLPLTIFPSLGRSIVLLSSSQQGTRVREVSSRCHMWNSGSSCVSLATPTSLSLISLLLLFLPPPHPSPPFRLKSVDIGIGPNISSTWLRGGNESQEKQTGSRSDN